MSRSKHAKTLAARRRENARRLDIHNRMARASVSSTYTIHRRIETLAAVIPPSPFRGISGDPVSIHIELARMIAKSLYPFLDIEQDEAGAWTARLEVVWPNRTAPPFTRKDIPIPYWMKLCPTPNPERR